MRPHDAHLVRIKLESIEIPAVVSDDITVSVANLPSLTRHATVARWSPPGGLGHDLHVAEDRHDLLAMIPLNLDAPLFV